METDLKIIFTHKDMGCPVGYEIIDNRKSDIDHRIWSEIAGMKILYDRIKKFEEDKAKNKTVEDFSEWIYLNHYRRHFDKDCFRRIYVPQPLVINGTLAQQYGACHNIKDLSICGQALKETFPQLVQQFEHVLNSNIIIPYIIGIMPVGQFKDYFEFLYKVLSNVLEKIGCKTYEELLEHVKNTEGYNVKMENRDNRPEYQVRIVSFLAERLASLYWLQCSKQVPVFPATIIKSEGAF